MENNLILYIGVFGAIFSPIISLYGMYLSHVEKKKVAENEAIKIKSDAEAEEIRVKAESARIEAETGKLNIENNSAQIQYYINIVEALRKEVAFFLGHSRELTDKVSTLEMKLSESEKEKNALKEDNEKLKVRVNSQETEIAELRGKVANLESQKPT